MMKTEKEMSGGKISAGRVCLDCLALMIFTSLISCATSTTIIPGISKTTVVSPIGLHTLNTVAITSIHSSSNPSLNEKSESPVDITHTTATSTLTATSSTENPSAVYRRQLSQRVSHCLHTQAQLVLTVEVLRLDSSNWNISSPRAAPLTCTLTLSVPPGQVLQLTHWRHSSALDCSEQNYIALTSGGSGHSVTITDCTDSWNRFTSPTSTLKMLINVGDAKALSSMTIIVQAVETALETGNITAVMGNETYVCGFLSRFAFRCLLESSHCILCMLVHE